MTPEQIGSHARSALKIGGGVFAAAGVSMAFESGALFVALFSILGTVGVMAGLGWSHVEHSPIGRAPITLRRVADDDGTLRATLPPEVADKIKETAS